MSRFILILFILVLPWQAQAQELSYLNATNVGVSGENLADTPVTDAIAMDAASDRFRNQIVLQVLVTWGTSTYVDAKCQGSFDGTNYTWIDKCIGANPVTCKPLVWRWQAADNADGLLELAAPNGYKWYKCQVDDPLDGTGTVSILAGRSNQ